MPTLLAFTILLGDWLWRKRRAALLLLVTASVLWSMRPGHQAGAPGAPDIDREALRSARTCGDIVLAQREGNDGSRLDRVDAVTGTTHLLRTEARCWFYTPTWASDGSQLAVSRQERRGMAIEIMDRNGRRRRVLKVNAWPWLAWRPGASQLAIANSLHGGEDGIHLLDLTSNRWTLLTAGVQELWLSWSPDGQYLAYSRLESERNIYVFSLASRREQVLCPGVVPAWDPRGDRLAVIPRNRDGIELVDTRTGQRKTLVSGITPGRLAWSPDGAYLLTDDTRDPNRAYLLVDVKTGATRAIGRPGGLVHGYSWTGSGSCEEITRPACSWPSTSGP